MNFFGSFVFLITLFLLVSLAKNYLGSRHKHDYDLERIINLQNKSKVSYAMIYVHICKDPSCAKVKKTFVEF